MHESVEFGEVGKSGRSSGGVFEPPCQADQFEMSSKLLGAQTPEPETTDPSEPSRTPNHRIIRPSSWALSWALNTEITSEKEWLVSRLKRLITETSNIGTCFVMALSRPRPILKLEYSFLMAEQRLCHQHKLLGRIKKPSKANTLGRRSVKHALTKYYCS